MKLSNARTWMVSGAFLVGAAACSSAPHEGTASTSSGSSAEGTASSQPGASDLASVMPPHLAIMLSMSWFGIPHSGDPLGPGPDTSWGNYKIPGQCSPTGEPQECVDGQRDIASRFRPLAGIGSSSGRDEEGLARIDLMLSNLRRPCASDVGARIDSFAIQLDGTKYSSLHETSPSESAEIPYQALLHAYSEANTAGLTNAVLPADDGTWYFNNGHWEGLDCTKDHAACVTAIQGDAIDMLTLAVNNPSSLRIAGKPVLYFYFASQLSPSEWATIFSVAKSTVIGGSTHDFYALGSHQGSGGAPYFAAFDGISPWIDLSAWGSTSGSTVRAHAAEYAASIHAELEGGVPAGHVVLGGIGPGFDDFTNGWSLCKTREIPSLPEASPRDPGVLDGMIDYLQTKGTKGVILETWDDWTEGSFFEPSVTEGTSKLEQLQARLGDLYGEPVASPVPLRDRYAAYGQPHGCAGLKPALRTTLCSAPPPSCSAPTILEPTASEAVGPAIQLRASAAACITSMVPYIDAAPIAAVSGSSIDEWVPVTKGTHTLYVTGLDATGQVYVSSQISFDRTY
jgi:hypothetical protein